MDKRMKPASPCVLTFIQLNSEVLRKGIEDMSRRTCRSPGAYGGAIPSLPSVLPFHLSVLVALTQFFKT